MNDMNDMKAIMSTLDKMNDAEYVLSVAVETLSLHEQGEEGYSLEDLIFKHYNATVHYYPRGNGRVEAWGDMFRKILTIEFDCRKKIATLIVDKMLIDGAYSPCPYRLEYKMVAPRFIEALADVKNGKLESKVIHRSMEEWKQREK